MISTPAPLLRSVSVVIPAYNEAVRLGETLNTIMDYLTRHVSEGEIIVVDDGSKDETATVAEKAIANSRGVPLTILRNERNRGKGFSVRTGLLAARSEIALFTDADLSTPISEAPKLIRPIEEGALDMAFGSRALQRGLIGIRQTWRREQSGKVFNLAVRLATGLPVWDTQCGFKAFQLEVCRPIIQSATIDGFAFDVELLYIGYRAGLRLQEIPVRWNHNEGSTVSMLRDSRRMLNEVRIVRKQAERGLYDKAVSASRAVARERGFHRNDEHDFQASRSDPSSKFLGAAMSDE